jgi:hypothetical protein
MVVIRMVHLNCTYEGLTVPDLGLLSVRWWLSTKTAYQQLGDHVTAGYLPTWNELSDLDKGAALLHLHKRDYEGASYAVENYPARYLDDPRLTALDSRAASGHAAQFRGEAEALTGTEYERLYNAALAEPDRRCLWAARTNHSRIVPEPTREAAIKLLTEHWPQHLTADDLAACALLRRDQPGGEWYEVAVTPEDAL